MSIKRPIEETWDQDLHFDYQCPYYGYYMPWQCDKKLSEQRYEETNKQGQNFHSKHLHWVKDGYGKTCNNYFKWR